MKSTILMVVVGVISIGLVLAILGLARVSQSDFDRAKELADLHAEKAMRLLDKYQANLTEIALLREQLARQIAQNKAPTTVPPRGDGLKEVVSGEALESFQALSREMARRSKQGPAAELEQRLRRLVPDASAIPPEPTFDLGQTEVQVIKGLEKAVRQVDQLIADNTKLLRQALREADAALQVQVGSAGMRDHFTANHLRAWALHLTGLEKRNEGLSRRLEAQWTRLRALRLIQGSAGILAQIKDAQGRMPDPLKKDLAAQEAELTQRLSDVRKRAAELNTQIDTLTKAFEAAQAEAKTATEALAALEAKGYDPKNPSDVTRYVDEYTQQAEKHRIASQRAMALRAGTLEGVRLDDAHGGDFLTDHYVPESGKTATRVKGLETLKMELEEARTEVKELESLLKLNATRAEQAETLRKELTNLLDKYRQEKKGFDQQIVALLNEADGAPVEPATAPATQAGKEQAPRRGPGKSGGYAGLAAEAEAEALSQLEAAGKAYAQAARAAGGRSGTSISDPELKKLTEDRDPEAAMLIGQAGVAYARSLVYLQQVRDLIQQMGVVKAAVGAEVPGVDKGRLQAIADELDKTQKAAVVAVDDAIKLGARNPFKGRKYDWVGQASVAAAYHLKSLLTRGDEAAEALGKAIAEYEGAVEKREGSPFLKPYVRALEYLRAGGGVAPAVPRPAGTQPTTTAPASKPTTAPVGVPGAAPLAAKPY